MWGVVVMGSRTGTGSAVDNTYGSQIREVLGFLNPLNLPSFCLVIWFHFPYGTDQAKARLKPQTKHQDLKLYLLSGDLDSTICVVF